MELKALINTERKEGWGQSKKAKTRKNECQDRRTRRLNKCTFLLLLVFFKLYDCTDNITRVYDNSLHCCREWLHTVFQVSSSSRHNLMIRSGSLFYRYNCFHMPCSTHCGE